MEKKTLGILGIVLIVAGIAGLVLISGNSPYTNRWIGHSGMMGDGMMGDMDRTFIEQMIPHHEDAVLMADLALQKAEHEELKQLAADIKTAQNREISDMRSWYKSWYGTEVPQNSMGMGRGMMSEDADIERLKNASPFDKEFIEQMIPHHQMAVMMAQMMLQASDRDEIRTLAQNIITSQSREITQMREWHKQWYP
ncbi:MAG: hypothetical protein MPEBLZ_00895 [Candidatus Methanoperedens nitroreducens]|uniref:DUF305 domain-containing protein n=1 Tax=Candidatus Methanoperedens nitratireducens TaxID=1392998 RepID=A0A0P7ZHS2_9EURY|nr:DUF305 domain-containing protein [Candidatus Methanoperedens sp. BLZ2]KAB2944348.1 MAG: DUF305 domain-containing protein [Candidatus Methanoperedens sp.]KPQ44528.1 MAG: hypothetical protein MPEBLZ_00895 [Candidatus Methanoperedens sp. BLZ1]MBZ0175319.1 DUF305 domain-containing protein [Candidatus Methanoperedens nitroreducens]MCX9079462.1 DUF305 domain-containing protein [Candidatus Methanoperedens sp.]MCX9088739.1 DUF305 domain-containing protein [Candidatus Methanoperedens sp.]